MKGIIIVLLLPLIYYILYSSGFMITGKKSAVVLVGKRYGTNTFRANFVSCDGQLKNIVRFRKSKTYQFKLAAGMTGGTASVELLDKEKQVILCLTPENPDGSIEVEKGKRYYMVYKFDSATGSYELTWE